MRSESKIVLINSELKSVYDTYMLKKATVPEKAKNSVSISPEKGEIQISTKEALHKLGLLGEFRWTGKIKKTVFREDYAEVQYGISGSGINSGTIWAQLIPNSDSETKTRLVIDLDPNLFSSVGVFLKFASDSQIQTVVDTVMDELKKILEKGD